MQHQECLLEFHFDKDAIFTLLGALYIPPQIKCSNGTKVSGLEGLCILLYHFAYPNHLYDLLHRFGHSVDELSRIFNHILLLLYTNWAHLLEFDHQHLTPAKLEEFAAAIHAKGAPLQHCWGFIDGTV